jgi:hypothetical protein
VCRKCRDCLLKAFWKIWWSGRVLELVIQVCMASPLNDIFLSTDDLWLGVTMLPLSPASPRYVVRFLLTGHTVRHARPEPNNLWTSYSINVGRYRQSCGHGSNKSTDKYFTKLICKCDDHIITSRTPTQWPFRAAVLSRCKSGINQICCRPTDFGCSQNCSVLSRLSTNGVRDRWTNNCALYKQPSQELSCCFHDWFTWQTFFRSTLSKYFPGHCHRVPTTRVLGKSMYQMILIIHI